MSNKNVAVTLVKLRSGFAGWKIDQLLMRYIDTRVGALLQVRDGNAIRVYECYADGTKERRWHPLRAMDANSLRAVMRETRTQARQLEIKGEGYQFFLDELEKLSPGARVDDVYDRAVPKIRAYKDKAA